MTHGCGMNGELAERAAAKQKDSNEVGLLRSFTHSLLLAVAVTTGLLPGVGRRRVVRALRG